jgi:hypothetical protein
VTNTKIDLYYVREVEELRKKQKRRQGKVGLASTEHASETKKNDIKRCAQRSRNGEMTVIWKMMDEGGDKNDQLTSGSSLGLRFKYEQKRSGFERSRKKEFDFRLS